MVDIDNGVEGGDGVVDSGGVRGEVYGEGTRQSPYISGDRAGDTRGAGGPNSLRSSANKVFMRFSVTGYSGFLRIMRGLPRVLRS